MLRGISRENSSLLVRARCVFSAQLRSVRSWRRTPRYELKAARCSRGLLAEDEPQPASPPFMIAGPVRSFLRMAGISQKVTPEEVLPLLSRNVFIQGYEGSSRPTEFLILLRRYVVQSRELAALAAGDGMVIRVSNCNDARPLLRILGYRARANCGEPDTSLQTEDPERAFLAIDSVSPFPNSSRRYKAANRSNTHTPLLRCRCYSRKAIGPRRARRTNRKQQRPD